MKISLQNINYKNTYLPKTQKKEMGSNFIAPQNVTSSLNILSSYNQATISFNGEISDKYNEIQELYQYSKKAHQLRDDLKKAKKPNGEPLFSEQMASEIDFAVYLYNIDLVEKLCFSEKKNSWIFDTDENFLKAISALNPYNIDIADRLYFSEDIIFDEKEDLFDTLTSVKENTIDLAEKLIFGVNEDGKDLFPDKKQISTLLAHLRYSGPEFAEKLCFAPLSPYISDYKRADFILKIYNSISLINRKKIEEVAEELIFGTTENNEPIVKDKYAIPKILNFLRSDDITKIKEVITLRKQNKILENGIFAFYKGNITFDEYQKTKEILGEEKLSKVPQDKMEGIIKAIPFYTDKDFSELTTSEKKDMLKFLIKYNFSAFQDIKINLDYPLIPQNDSDVIKLISNIVNSLSMEIEEITHEEDEKFNTELNALSSTLANLSDEEFNNLTISYENQVLSNNKELEKSLNEIFNIFPKLIDLIGKKQHKTHHFDVFKHSLKVMQKITQNPQFNNLNESDKKILLIASLFHDFCKTEDKENRNHAENSAFEAFYITKKLNLSKEETNKLYSLIKNHEWLKEINKSDYDDENKIIKSFAYDLHYGNLFELSKIFTEADLKAVKRNDAFFDKYLNKFKSTSLKIEEQINGLKNTQPLLPITKFPSSSRIKEAITEIKPDGSTNLKGIYIGKKGLVIIRYNEVENETWEKIGFPKGSCSNGIKFTHRNRIKKKIKLNTGNIKFFVHGLEKEQQIRNFDAFTLPDTDALLSVSYAERPESKYKFFRTQGVILNTDAQYIHGGGDSDSGSGCKKSIDLFKKDYAFPFSKYHNNRIYISDLIKEDLKLNNAQYRKLIEQNANKPLCEIEPKKLQEKLIKAYASINSNIRIGEREYNEMYISNPEVMATYAYSPKKGVINNIMKFVREQERFIKNYAVEKDIPMVIFDDYEK